jgi:hypothetical protein
MADSDKNLPSSDVLVNRFFMSPQEKAKKETGKKILQQFYQQQTGATDNLNYFQARNARWIQLLMWCKGSQSMKEFLDYTSVSDGNKAWVNMDMTQQRIAPKFVGTLVESMAKTSTYACVDAVDDYSMTEKQDRMFEALFRMHEVETIAAMQQQSGVQLEPEGVYIPDDELAAKIHFELEDKLPKEIKFEEMIQTVKDCINFERVANRKTLYDLVALNIAALKIEKIGPKKYTIRKCIPTNLVYNFFMNDIGDPEVTMIGEFYNLKVKDFREKFGQTAERPDGLTEKDIFNLAKLSNNKNIGTFNYLWNDNFANLTFNQVRPYDDSSILILDAEINCGEDVYYVEKMDMYGKMNISPKTSIPYTNIKKDGTIIEQPKPDDVTINKRQRNTWMRGVYVPNGDKLLYWGTPDIIITPYTDVAKPLSSYCINIPNNDGDYVPSLFERIMEPLREYTVVKLKRKQLISQLRPAGYRIDIETARNLDLGNGDTIDWLEVVRIYNQTGIELWSSKGVDPLSKEGPPISNTAADTAVQKIVELTNILSGILAEIRELIGVPQYRDGSDVGDRTSGVLQEQQSAASFNVTDFISNGNDQVWEEAFYKLCLLHWNDIVKEEPESKDDMLNTRFRVKVKTKSTEYQRELLEKDIDRYSKVVDANGNPAITPKDAMYLREIDNYKLARWYMANTIDMNRKKSLQDSERLQQQNAEVQQQSAQMAAQKEQETQAAKLQADERLQNLKYAAEKELAVLQGISQIAAKGLELPPYYQQLLPLLIPNIQMPLAIQNKQTQSAIQAGEQAEQQAMMQQQQEESGEAPPEQGQEQMQGEEEQQTMQQ